MVVAERIIGLVFLPVILTILVSSAAGQDSIAPVFSLNHTDANEFDRLLTTNCDEAQKKASAGYESAGIVGFLKTAPADDTTAIHRFLIPGPAVRHFYTTLEDEGRRLHFKSEGMLGYVSSRQLPGTKPLYRIYKSSIGDHYYTADDTDKQNAENYGYSEKFPDGLMGYIWAVGPKVTCTIPSKQEGPCYQCSCIPYNQDGGPQRIIEITPARSDEQCHEQCLGAYLCIGCFSPVEPILSDHKLGQKVPSALCPALPPEGEFRPCRQEWRPWCEYRQ